MHEGIGQRKGVHPGRKALTHGAVLVAGLAVGTLLASRFTTSRQVAAPAPRAERPAATIHAVQELPREEAASEISESRRNAIVRAAEEVGPGVVSLSVTQLVRRRVSSLFDDPFFSYFFPSVPNQYLQEIYSMGSGVVIDPKGYVLTNTHVVESASKIVATLTDGRSFEAELLGADPASDLSVLRIHDGSDLPCAELGDSDDIIIGEWAIAIGNPFGYVLKDSRPTVTVGVISAVGRNFERGTGERQVYRDMIQTDAAINRGNSGGPLVNSEGKVIGINTFIISQTGGSIGLGFAIPINRAKRVVRELLAYGETRAVWTGIEMMPITSYMAYKLGISNDQGVLVSRVASDSPAERAGAKPGDIVRRINGEKIANEQDALRALDGLLVGDEVTLTLERDHKEKSVTFKLQEARSRSWRKK